jgi:lipid II:glycine glycyltransferase (peptidoglycan interpeptide bridge formation enzyme)
MRVLWPGDPAFPSPSTWDEFVGSDPRGHLLQSWAWGDLKARFGWRPLRLMIVDRDQPVAAAQLLIRPLPYGSLAYVPRGPAFDETDVQVSQALLDALHTAARRERAVVLKVEPNWLDSAEATRWWTDRGFAETPQTVQPRSTIILDLQPDEDAILAQMTSKCRYCIRLAARREVTVRQASGDDLLTFYDLMRETGERNGFPIHSQAYYEAAFLLFQAANRAAFFLAEYQGEPLAAVMAFAFGQQATYMYGASSNRERARSPNHLLQWEVIRWARAWGCTRYDLYGVPDVDPASPIADLSGVEHFKASFGGRQTRHAGAFDYVYSPALFRAFNRLYQLRRAATRRLAPRPGKQERDAES